MAITLSKRAILGLAVGAAALGVAVFFLTTTEDDQNPIRVKNKQLLIEMEDKDAKWKKLPLAAEKWRVEVGNKLASDLYTVTAYGANPEGTNPCLQPLQGDTAEIQFRLTTGQVAILTFTLPKFGDKSEPQLEVSGATMKEDNEPKKVKRLQMNNPSGGTTPAEGTITQLSVLKAGAAVGACSFPADRKVLIELCTHRC